MYTASQHDPGVCKGNLKFVGIVDVDTTAQGGIDPYLQNTVANS